METRVFLLAIATVVVILAAFAARAGGAEGYSVGYQIGPHYLGDSTWQGTPYLGLGVREGMTADIVHSPSFVQAELREHALETGTNWAPPADSMVGRGGLPPASDRPDFWAGPQPGVPDLTVHTYRMRDALPPLCRPASSRSAWRQYGGSRGWTFSPYY